jgi:hypothetical protein
MWRAAVEFNLACRPGCDRRSIHILLALPELSQLPFRRIQDATQMQLYQRNACRDLHALHTTCRHGLPPLPTRLALLRLHRLRRVPAFPSLEKWLVNFERVCYLWATRLAVKLLQQAVPSV